MSSTARAALAVAATLLVTGTAADCAGNARPGAESADDGAVALDSLVGEVRQVGSTPFARTLVEDGDTAVTVTGPLEPELVRLVGARVRVVGSRVEGDGPGTTVRVERYDVLSVDGEEPRVGVLGYEAGAGYRLTTESGETIPLTSVPTRLGTEVGGKVWVVLSDAGGVLRYGVLREP